MLQEADSSQSGGSICLSQVCRASEPTLHGLRDLCPTQATYSICRQQSMIVWAVIMDL